MSTSPFPHPQWNASYSASRREGGALSESAAGMAGVLMSCEKGGDGEGAVKLGNEWIRVVEPSAPFVFAPRLWVA